MSGYHDGLNDLILSMGFYYGGGGLGLNLSVCLFVFMDGLHSLELSKGSRYSGDSIGKGSL